jgi:hypothetical protein
MSLHQIAQHLQDAGRNGDTMLVHMTPGEVSGLQALAKAHGGSLTINPETGLPESFFLAAILPTILGAGMQAAGMSALNAALLTGAIGTAVTGDLGQGIMAGLGAYGGAGLAGGLSKVGTTAAKAPAMNVATAGVEGMKQNLYGAGQGIFSNFPTAGGAAANAATNPLATQLGNMPQLTNAGMLDITKTLGGAGLPTGVVPSVPPAPPVAAAAPVSAPVFDVGASLRSSQAATPMNLPTEATVADVVPQSAMDKFSAGLKRATSGTDGLKEVLAASEEVAPYSGLASLANVVGGMTSSGSKAPKSKAFIRPYRLRRDYEQSGYGDTGYGTSERRYFDDEYTALEPYEAPGPEYAADGGLMGLANFDNGGYVRYTGDRPLDEDKDDYYYVPGTAAGSGYYMIREGTQGGAGGLGSAGSTGPHNYDYDRATGKFTQKAGTAPKLSTNPQAYSAEMLNPLYQQYFGRDVDPEGIAAYTARNFAPSELDTIFKAAPEYAARQQQLAAEKKEASYATPTQVANMYGDILGRTVDPAALAFYGKENRMTPAELKKTLMQSDEYLTKLTKPFVPAPKVDQGTGLVAIEGALRTPQQEAARPRDMSNFYAMMDQKLAEQAKRQGYATGGPVEQMSAMNAVGNNALYPQSQLQTPVYSNPMMQRPTQTNVVSHGLDAPVDPYTGEQRFAGGGLSSLGGYSDGGRLLRGPGDGVSDSIPAVIGKRQPARLADGEFVVPARIVSELGNGSTEAGARKLYAMMDRIQKTRK